MRPTLKVKHTASLLPDFPQSCHHSTAQMFTTATAAAAVRESSWLLKHQMWGWHWLCSTDLGCWLFYAENLVLHQHCGQGRDGWKEDESEAVGGLRPGETLAQQMGRFRLSASPSCCRRLSGQRTPTVQSDTKQRRFSLLDTRYNGVQVQNWSSSTWYNKAWVWAEQCCPTYRTWGLVYRPSIGPM